MNDITLTPDQASQFKEALRDAFRRDDLDQVVFFGLGVRLDDIVTNATYDNQVKELVMWANSENLIGLLLAKARSKNPGNIKLRDFGATLTVTTQQSPVPPPDDNQPTLPQPSGGMLEALIFGPQRDSRVPYAYFEGAAHAAHSIARLAVPRILAGTPDGNLVYGTGWLIAPGILMTNHHVIDARDRRPKPHGLGELPATPADFHAQSERITMHFDYYEGQTPGKGTLELRGTKLLATNAVLDYAVIALDEANKVIDRLPLTVLANQPLLARGDRFNIAQHPKGGSMRFAIRNNFYVRRGDNPASMLYQTDTEPGASGSPVCNDQWEVLALHHASVVVDSQSVPQEVISGQPNSVTVLNEAIALAAILADLPVEVRKKVVGAQVGG